jgi:hypothetical protein
MNLNFKVGDYVDTHINGCGYIVDILKSETSDRIVVCIEFAYNFPNPRKFDMINVTPDFNLDMWTVVDRSRFDNALTDKALWLIDRVEKRTE